MWFHWWYHCRSCDSTDDIIADHVIPLMTSLQIMWLHWWHHCRSCESTMTSLQIMWFHWWHHCRSCDSMMTSLQIMIPLMTSLQIMWFHWWHHCISCDSTDDIIADHVIPLMTSLQITCRSCDGEDYAQCGTGTYWWSTEAAETNSYQETHPQAGEVENPFSNYKPNREEKIWCRKERKD